MPVTFEIVDDIIEEIADKLGVYEGKYSEEEKSPNGHPEDCDCRICFTTELRHRLDKAYENEKRLKNI